MSTHVHESYNADNRLNTGKKYTAFDIKILLKNV